MANRKAIARIVQELKSYKENECYSIEPDETNIYKCTGKIYCAVEPFQGGVWSFEIKFPNEYPLKPFEFKFTSDFPHPNIHQDGRMCISILHEGIDETGYESSSIRWSPVQNINSVLMSIISMLNDPNLDSPANVDMTKLWRDNRKEYNKIIYKIIAKQHNH